MKDKPDQLCKQAHTASHCVINSNLRRWIRPQESPSYGNPLFLSPAQLEAPLPHHCVVAIRKASNGIRESSHLSSLNDFLPTSRWSAVCDVAEQSVVEENSVLWDNSHCSSQAGLHAKQVGDGAGSGAVSKELTMEHHRH